MANAAPIKNLRIKPAPAAQSSITTTQYKNYQDFITRHYVDKEDREQACDKSVSHGSRGQRNGPSQRL